MKYVAVVGARRESYSGKWSCFVGDDKAGVVEQAIKARLDWGPRDYVVWVGTLTEEATVPVRYKLKPLKDS